MTAARWIDAVSDRPTAEVARELGYEIGRTQTASHCKCPACGAERRHTKSGDRRGAVGMPHRKPGWHCFQCEASGDAVDFVAYHVGGQRFRDLDSFRREEVRAWFDPTSMIAVVPPKRLQRPPSVAWENADCVYPPRDQVQQLWDSCVPVDHDDDALAYLAHRKILGIEQLVAHDCVRALPEAAMCPDWARFEGQTWTASGHRLVIPLYDFLGDMRSLVGRSVEREPRVKSVGAAGFQRRGLVMAATYAREMLVAGPQARMHRLEQFRLAVYEGEINWMLGVASGADDVIEEDFQPAAFRGALGIFSGSFTRDIASRVPRKTDVRIRTDADEAGEKYAAEITEQLNGRTTITLELEPND
jgi:hypothetical protein